MAGSNQPLGCAFTARLLDGLGQAVIATDTELKVTYWNAAAEAAFGWSTEEIRGQNILDVAVPGFVRSLGNEIVSSLVAGHSWSGGFTVRRKDSTTFTALVTADGVRDDDGALVGIVAVASNIGQMLRPLLIRSQEAALVTGAYGLVRFATPAIERVLGWRDVDLAGRSLLDLVHPQDQQSVEECVQASLTHPLSGPTVEFRARTACGDWTWVEGQVADLRDDPSVLGLVWTLRDTSTHRAALESMTDVALHDPLTGLPNRIVLRDRLTVATSRREPHGALLFIDIDGLKLVNDNLGHAGGDTLLKNVAHRLSRVVRPEDTCGRWSGDEFLVLNESLNSMAEAVAFADRLATAIAEPLDIGGQVITAQASIGVAMLDGVHDPEQIIHVADEQMYLVKVEHRAAEANEDGAA